jgi:tRNA-specific 2-thiouridylase
MPRATASCTARAQWAKDQSYVLGVLTTEQLAHAYFPLGETPSKQLVREEAARRGLSVAQKPDSHDICFIPDGDTKGWLAERVGVATGEIVDRTGAVVGSHEGRARLHRRPASRTAPRHARARRTTALRARGAPEGEHGGRGSEGGARDRRDRRLALHVGRARTRGCRDAVRLRGADPRPRRPRARGGGGRRRRARDHPGHPLDGVAPGQTAVVYVGTRVLGQCTIDRTVSAVPATA